MLLSLHIENLAIINCIDIDFTGGFMVLTGETGAGKSIIIDGINLLLGAKANKELIRTGTTTAMVSGVFSDLSFTASEVLLSNGISPDEEGCILIQRSFSTDGRSQIKINGRTVTLAVLKAVIPTLVNIHGQSDTLALTDAENQLDIVDLYADNTQTLSEFSEAYTELSEVRRQIREILDKEHERERLIEILKYQIEDIDSYGLHAGEEEELVDKKVKIKNGEKITKNSSFVFKALKGSEKGSVSYLLDRSATALEQLSDVIPEFSTYSETLRDVLYKVDDVAEEVYAIIADMDEDPEVALNEIESRLDKISKLKRKYGYTVADILSFAEKARAELSTLENSESLIIELEKREKALYEKTAVIADALHERRKSSALEIEREVKEILEFLDMPKVTFFISVKREIENGKLIFNQKGADTVEFYISANRGAEPQPLSKIASGGELARVMLALKSVVADKDGISTVIFDEIDAGVSGKTARKIGIKMLSLSKNTQLFAVTHSAQIASLADIHFLISKSDVNGVTETSVTTLDREGRIKELSRILGGIDVTASQREAAIDMLEEKKNY